MSIFDSISSKVSGAIGDSGVVGAIAGGASTIGMGMLKSSLPLGAGPQLSAIANAGEKILNGDFAGAALGAINSGIFTSKFPWLANAAATGAFLMQPNRSMGGVKPMDAKRIMQTSLQTKFAHKNLFLLEIKSMPPNMPDGGNWLSSASGAGGGLQMFNLFVTDISYTGFSISSDQQKVGAHMLDQPNGRDPFELRITTMDNEAGDVKMWFNFLASQVAKKDGTMGVPVDYLIKIKLLHGFVTEASQKQWVKKWVWARESWFRPVSIEHDLSRKDDGPEEMALVLHRFDAYFE